jgi:trans-aconitate methyltransferase
VLLRPPTEETVRWADLCCGTGRALVDAAAALRRTPGAEGVRIEGVDLVGMFDHNPFPDVLTLREASLEEWNPSGPCRLITCVHGLHYVGDKLGAVARAARHLSPDGLLIAHLDPENFRFADGRSAARTVLARLRREGFTFDTRKRLLRRAGTSDPDFGLRYLGADDTAGPNFTGQPAVHSVYGDVAVPAVERP